MRAVVLGVVGALAAVGFVGSPARADRRPPAAKPAAKPIASSTFEIQRADAPIDESASVADLLVGSPWSQRNRYKKTSTYESTGFTFAADGTAIVTIYDLGGPIRSTVAWKALGGRRVRLGARTYVLAPCGPAGGVRTVCLLAR